MNVTNYEMLAHFDSSAFGGIVLDESSILGDNILDAQHSGEQS